jgi:hypothetical protein
MAKRKRPVTIQVCRVSHRHGTDVYLDWTKRGLDKQVADYAREWWGEWDFDEKMPRSNKAVIEAYFDSEKNEEWCEFTDVRMPPK